MYFSTGRFPFELAQRPSRVALASHIARSSTPFGVTSTTLFGAAGAVTCSQKYQCALSDLKLLWEGHIRVTPLFAIDSLGPKLTLGFPFQCVCMSCASCRAAVLCINPSLRNVAAKGYGYQRRLQYYRSFVPHVSSQTLEMYEDAHEHSTDLQHARRPFDRNIEHAGKLDGPSNSCFHSYWIPFGDHPLKLERYRED